MLYKFFMSVYKETLLLKRDFGGLVILFVMPLILIITITLIQDGTYKSMSDVKIPILLVDNDNDTISKTVRKNLNESGSFEVVTQLNGKNITEGVAQEAVFKGKYQLAIIIPEKLSSDLQLKVNQNVDRIVSSFGLTDSISSEVQNQKLEPKEIKLYFDPATQLS
ncbi:MAG: ABC transporter permease, partial [Flavobacterium sp.]|nr:ABC transporter permease [Flavobacterium sp.]